MPHEGSAVWAVERRECLEGLFDNESGGKNTYFYRPTRKTLVLPVDSCLVQKTLWGLGPLLNTEKRAQDGGAKRMCLPPIPGLGSSASWCSGFPDTNLTVWLSPGEPCDTNWGPLKSFAFPLALLYSFGLSSAGGG